MAIAAICAGGGLSCKKTGEAKCGDCFEEGYKVSIPSTAELKPPAAVLFSGFRNGWCQQDLVCTGTPDVFLGTVKAGPLDYQASCDKRELVAFAGGHAPTVADLTPDQPGQTIGMKPPAQIDLTAWIVNSAASAVHVQDDIQTAQNRFTDLAAGVALNAVINGFPPGRLSEVPELYSNASCDLVGKLTGMVNAPVGFDKDRLNVYYVEGFSVTMGAPAGITCADQSGVLPPVIFVDGEVTSSPAVLPHEIGHALGLIRSIPLPGGGYAAWAHTNEVMLDPYLHSDNLMQSGGTFVGQITLGQIYRMHFDELSWLWRNQTGAGGYPRKCQDNPVEGGLCPALTRYPPRGWP